eukprot:7157630-Prymnesium_polylepis.1
MARRLTLPILAALLASRHASGTWPAAQADHAEQAGEDAYEEPGIEPSSLARRRATTHDDSGVQFNFVSSEVDDDESASEEGAVRSGGTTTSLKELLETMSQAQAALRQRTATLPPVPKDAPLSE